MKNNKGFKKIFISAICIGSFFTAGAQQQRIDPTLEVTRDFDATMMNIYKTPLSTKVNDSLLNFNLNFDYSFFNKPYRDLYEFSPVPSVQILSPVEVRQPVFMLKAKMGYPVTPAAEIYLQPRLRNGNILSFNAGYNGFYHNQPAVRLNEQKGVVEADKDYRIPANSSDLFGNLNYAKYWSGSMLSITGFYNFGQNIYYGYNSSYFLTFPDKYNDIKSGSYMKDSSSHRFNQAGAALSVRSIDSRKTGKRFNYRLDFSYKYTSDRISGHRELFPAAVTSNSLNENLISISGEIGPNFGKYNRFTIGFNSENVIYSGIQDYKYGLYEIIPRYSLNLDRFTLRVGVKLSGRYKGKADTDKFHNPFFINADAIFEAVKDKFWIYGKIDGYNCINSYSSILESNRWISPAIDMKATAVPFLAEVGFRGIINNRFNYRLYANFASVEGLLQFIYMGNNLLESEYSNTKRFTAGVDIKYKNRRFELASGFSYASYSNVKKSLLNNGQPFGTSPINFYLDGEYNFRERIYIGVSAVFRDKIHIYDIYYASMEGNIEAPAYLKLGVNLKYLLKRNLALFLEGENLLNSDIVTYPNYVERGIGFGAGVLVKF